MFIYFWERERARAQAKEAQKEGRYRIWRRLQALSCQHRAQRGAQINKLWDHDQSRIRTFNQLSHPGAPIWGQFLRKVLVVIPQQTTLKAGRGMSASVLKEGYWLHITTPCAIWIFGSIASYNFTPSGKKLLQDSGWFLFLGKFMKGTLVEWTIAPYLRSWSCTLNWSSLSPTIHTLSVLHFSHPQLVPVLVSVTYLAGDPNHHPEVLEPRSSFVLYWT